MAITLQIDVIDEIETYPALSTMRCKMYVDGMHTDVYIPKSTYEKLIEYRFFIRDGKTPDTQGVLNTTNEFIER